MRALLSRMCSAAGAGETRPRRRRRRRRRFCCHEEDEKEYDELYPDMYIYIAGRPGPWSDYTPLGQERIIPRRAPHPAEAMGGRAAIALPPHLRPLRRVEMLTMRQGEENGEVGMPAQLPQRPIAPRALAVINPDPLQPLISPTSTYARSDGFSHRTIGTVVEGEPIHIHLHPVLSVGRPPVFRNGQSSEPLRRKFRSRVGVRTSAVDGQTGLLHRGDELRHLWRRRYELRDERSENSPGGVTYPNESESPTRPSCPVGRENIGIAL